MEYDLSRFVPFHQMDYARALSEIKNGMKITHWMWYIFPILRGLGRSGTAWQYGLQGLGEAQAFLQDEYLGAHLKEISSALLRLENSDPVRVMGKPDDWKLQASMTLFSLVAPHETVFTDVLDKYFHGRKEHRTLKMLGL